MQQVRPLEIGIPVADLELMVSFYTTVFGCKEVRRADIPAELSQKIRVAKDGYVNVWLEFPGGEVVKLVRPATAPSPQTPLTYAAEETGIAYFTLYCDDIVAAVQAAEAHGAQMVSDRSLFEAEVPVKVAFLKDPEGNVFEFVES